MRRGMKEKGKECKKSISVCQMCAKYMNGGLLCCRHSICGYVLSQKEDTSGVTDLGKWQIQIQKLKLLDGPLVRHSLCSPIRSMDAMGGTCIVKAGRPGAGMGLAWASGIASFVSQIMQFYVISILLFIYLQESLNYTFYTEEREQRKMFQVPPQAKALTGSCQCEYEVQGDQIQQ